MRELSHLHHLLPLPSENAGLIFLINKIPINVLVKFPSTHGYEFYDLWGLDNPNQKAMETANFFSVLFVFFRGNNIILDQNVC